MTKVAAKKTAKPTPSQRERALTAIERMPCFDKYCLEKLQAVLEESQNGPPDGQADGSIDRETWVQMDQLFHAARGVNSLRREFPKPWVAT
jgi:hypothetical protein